MSLSPEEYMVKRGISHEAVERKREELQARIEAYELAEIRKMAGLTQTEVGERMGVSQKRISEIEHGSIESVRAGTLKRYAAALGGRLHIQLECALPNGEMRIVEMPVLA
ncbi:helix-turn-helix domain-containing protein [Eggerthellaceae bacterium 24-137]